MLVASFATLWVYVWIMQISQILKEMQIRFSNNHLHTRKHIYICLQLQIVVIIIVHYWMFVTKSVGWQQAFSWTVNSLQKVKNLVVCPNIGQGKAHTFISFRKSALIVISSKHTFFIRGWTIIGSKFVLSTMKEEKKKSTLRRMMMVRKWTLKEEKEECLWIIHGFSDLKHSQSEEHFHKLNVLKCVLCYDTFLFEH